MHWLAQCHAKWPRSVKEVAPWWNQTHVTDSFQLALTTKSKVHTDSPKKQCMTHHILKPICFMQHCLFLDCWRILVCKPFIDIRYHIGHRLELKYFHFAHFFFKGPLSSSSTSEQWELRTWNLDKLLTKADCSKNLQIENRSSSCQCWSLNGFQTSHFICNQFGCKLWLLLVQNHARHRFQAFALCHLKSLCCAIRIWADALYLDLLLCTEFNLEHAV